MLKKAIGKKTLFLLSINAILGTGIFFLPALGVAVAGSASIFSWALMSIVAIFISMYFAELVSLFPKSGGVYEYVKRAFGEFPAFIAGWIACVVANITIAMLVVGSLYYLFPGSSPVFYTFLSLAIIILFNYISYRGIDISSKVLIFFGLVTLAAVFIVILPGVFHINVGNFIAAFPFHIPAVLLAVYFISETFFGWETVTYLSEEVKNARRVIPKIIVFSTIAIAAISLLVVFVAIGITDSKEFSAQKAPLSHIVSIMFGTGVANIYTILVFIPLIGTAASWIISSPRLLYAMSRDRVLINSFKSVHPKYKTPDKAILFQTLASAFIVVLALGSYSVLLYMLVPLVMILYSLVLLCIPKLRKSMPHAKRHFTAPFAHYGPPAIVVFNGYLVYLWLSEFGDALQIFVTGVIFVSFGIPLYLLIKLQTDKNFVEKFYDSISFVWDRSFKIWYGEKEIRKVISKLKFKRRAAVLDFGCGSCITTLALAKKVGRKGTIVAVDISERQLEKTFSKIEKAKEISNVILLREDDLKFPPHSFDAITVVDVLEHLENPEETLRKLFTMLKKGGTFSMLSFGRSFGIPAAEHVQNKEKIMELFSQAGIKPSVRTEKRKFTEYVYIWGKK